MKSTTRITGVQEQLQQLLDTLTENCPNLSSNMDQRGDLICNLSSTSMVEDWAEVAHALGQIGDAIRNTGIGDICILVETQFEVHLLPAGGVVSDELRVSHIGLEAMARLGADFEISVLRSSPD